MDTAILITLILVLLVLLKINREIIRFNNNFVKCAKVFAKHIGRHIEEK